MELRAADGLRQRRDEEVCRSRPLAGSGRAERGQEHDREPGEPRDGLDDLRRLRRRPSPASRGRGGRARTGRRRASRGAWRAPRRPTPPLPAGTPRRGATSRTIVRLRLVVVDDQHAEPVEVGCPARPPARSALARVSSNQNVLPSPGTLSRPIRPAHQADEAPADRQPEPGAAVPAAASPLDLGEALEDVGLVLLRDADAGVPDRESGASPRASSCADEPAPPGSPRPGR